MGLISHADGATMETVLAKRSYGTLYFIVRDRDGSDECWGAGRGARIRGMEVGSGRGTQLEAHARGVLPHGGEM